MGTTDQFQRYVATDIQRNQQLVSDFLTSYQGNPTTDNLTALVKKLPDRIVALRIHENRTAGKPATTSGPIRDRDMGDPAMKQAVVFR